MCLKKFQHRLNAAHTSLRQETEASQSESAMESDHAQEAHNDEDDDDVTDAADLAQRMLHRHESSNIEDDMRDDKTGPALSPTNDLGASVTLAAAAAAAATVTVRTPQASPPTESTKLSTARAVHFVVEQGSNHSADSQAGPSTRCCQWREGLRIAFSSCRNKRRAPLRPLVVVTAIALLLLVPFMIADSLLAVKTEQDQVGDDARLNQAGRRRSLSRRVVNMARELIVNDGQFAPLERVSELLLYNVALSEKVHRALLHGDADLGVPPTEELPEEQEHLMFGADVRAFRFDSSSPLPSSEVLSSDMWGADAMLHAFWEYARRIHAVYKDPDAPRPPRTWSGLMSEPLFRQLVIIESGPLINDLVLSSKLYAATIESDLETYSVGDFAILGTDVVMTLVAFVVLGLTVRHFQIMVARLREALLLSVPSLVRHLMDPDFDESRGALQT